MGALLTGLAPDDPDAKHALDLLRAWDHRLEPDSAAAALFELWWTRHLKPAVIARLAPEPVRRLLPPGDVEGILEALERPDERFGPDPAAARDALLIGTLAAAVRDAASRMGANWAWGRLHHGYFEHPLTSLRASSDRTFDTGPLPIGGSSSTPMHTGYRAGDFRAIDGASFRMVVDVGNWDRSVCINAPGQSGDPRSPHYNDLAPLWAGGRYVPMLYTGEAVAREAELRIVLDPA
jgi:penicillin amidase